MLSRKKLTDEEWRRVFSICCRAKQGQSLAKEERTLISRAFNEDPERYTAMQPDVFDATVPFGSNVKAKRGP